MAERPWATPDDVRDYTDRASVKARTDAKLAVDITRAEQYVIAYTKNDFADNEKFPEVPVPVKTAVILLAEHYGFKAKTGGMMKSETYDDYSYTAAEGTLIDLLDLRPLLDAFVVTTPKGGVTMKLRKM